MFCRNNSYILLPSIAIDTRRERTMTMQHEITDETNAVKSWRSAEARGRNGIQMMVDKNDANLGFLMLGIPIDREGWNQIDWYVLFKQTVDIESMVDKNEGDLGFLILEIGHAVKNWDTEIKSINISKRQAFISQECFFHIWDTLSECIWVGTPQRSILFTIFGDYQACNSHQRQDMKLSLIHISEPTRPY